MCRKPSKAIYLIEWFETNELVYISHNESYNHFAETHFHDCRSHSQDSASLTVTHLSIHSYNLQHYSYIDSNHILLRLNLYFQSFKQEKLLRTTSCSYKADIQNWKQFEDWGLQLGAKLFRLQLFWIHWILVFHYLDIYFNASGILFLFRNSIAISEYD